MSKDSVSFSHSDAWLFASLGGDGDEPVPLVDLVMRADMLNHAIPTFEETSEALRKLIGYEYVEVSGDAFSLTELGIQVYGIGSARKGGLFAIVGNMASALNSSVGTTPTGFCELKIDFPTRVDFEVACEKYSHLHDTSS